MHAGRRREGREPACLHLKTAPKQCDRTTERARRNGDANPAPAAAPAHPAAAAAAGRAPIAAPADPTITAGNTAGAAVNGRGGARQFLKRLGGERRLSIYSTSAGI